MDEDLTSDIPRTGYLTGWRQNQKASLRWTDSHIIEVESLVSETFLDQLRKFLTKKLIICVEILNSRYPFRLYMECESGFRLVLYANTTSLSADNDVFEENISV